MLRPPDFLWVCQKCGKEIEGYSEAEFEISYPPPMVCPDPKCGGYMQKSMEKKGGQLEEHPFKKY